MDATELRELLEALRRPEDSELPEGCPREEVADFAEEYELCLPEEYFTWLGVTNGPLVGDQPIYGIDPWEEPLNVRYMYDLYPDWIQKGWVPIAGDGCGNSYLLDTKETYGPLQPVVFFEPMHSREKPVYVVASGVWKFVESFLRRQLERDAWPWFDEEFVVSYDPKIQKVHGIPLPWEA